MWKYGVFGAGNALAAWAYQGAGLVLAWRADLRMLDREAAILGHEQGAAVLEHKERAVQTSGIRVFKISERLYIKGIKLIIN